MQNLQKRTLKLSPHEHAAIPKLENLSHQQPALIPQSKVMPVKKIKHKKQIQSDEPFSANFKNSPACKPSRWSREEDRLYMQFLKLKKNQFDCENLRRTSKVFMHLSKAMQGMRTASQCKSHHQKMQKATNSGNVRQIVAYLEKKYSFSCPKVEEKAEEQWQNLIKENLEQTGASASQETNGGEVILVLDLDCVSTW